MQFCELALAVAVDKMLPFLLAVPSLQLPAVDVLRSSVLRGLETSERGVYTAERQREELGRRLRDRLSGGDGLSRLAAADYAVRPGTSVVITGATEGIGREAARFLADANIGVIVCARDAAKAETAASYIREAGANASLVRTVTCDLSSVDSVDAASGMVLAAAEEMGAPLRGLLLNAGVWPTSKQITADGAEVAWQSNHLGHFQLANQLLPAMAESAGDADELRVVTVSSSAHGIPSALDLDDVTWERRKFDASINYGETKLANLLFAQELAERAPSPRFKSLAVHPGVVATSLFRDFGAAAPPAQVLGLLDDTPLGLVFRSPRDGCRSSLYALLSPTVPNGAYVVDCEPTDTSPASKAPRARAELWEWSAAWLRARGIDATL